MGWETAPLMITLVTGQKYKFVILWAKDERNPYIVKMDFMHPVWAIMMVFWTSNKIRINDSTLSAITGIKVALLLLTRSYLLLFSLFFFLSLPLTDSATTHLKQELFHPGFKNSIMKENGNVFCRNLSLFRYSGTCHRVVSKNFQKLILVPSWTSSKMKRPEEVSF